VTLYFYPKFIIKRDEEGKVVRDEGDRHYVSIDTAFLDRVKASVDEERQNYAMWSNRYAWLPMIAAGEGDEDNSLDVEINLSPERGFPDNMTRILVTNLRRMRSTWMLVQMFKRRMPKLNAERGLPLVRQDMGRLFGRARE
jgi:hypothetical protein